MKRMMILADYRSVYGGNFVPSLLSLENSKSYSDCHFIYAFPNAANERTWVKQIVDDGHEVIFLDFDSGSIKLFREVNKFVKEKAVSILYIHFSHFIVGEMISALHKNVRVYAHIHSDFSAGKQSYKMKIYNLCIYKLFSGRVRFISVSPAWEHFNHRKCFFVPNGLAKKRIGCTHMLGSEYRTRKAISDDTILVELFGWSPKVKGVDIAVEATKELVNCHGMKIKLLIVCGREYTEERMKQYIKSNTTCSGDEDFIIFEEPIEDVFRYHEAADICLSASRSEGFSYSILEMMSLGKRCVISDIPGLEWAKSYPSNVYFEAESINSCIDAINKVLLLPKWVEFTADAVSRDYSIDNWIEQVSKIVN